MIEKNEKELENLKEKKHNNSENIIAKLLDEKTMSLNKARKPEKIIR